MLGHKDPSVTLRVYADLFDTDLDVVAASLHAKYSPEKCVQNVSTGLPLPLDRQPICEQLF
jgi:hypothetical protein